MKKFVSDHFRQVDRRALVYALLLLLFMVLFERTAFRVNYRHYLLLVFVANKAIFALYIAAVLGSLVCAFLFFYTSLVAPKKYKLIYFLLFTLAIAFEYGYQTAMGRFSYFTDLQRASFTNSEQKLAAIKSYLNWMALIPCAIYGVALLLLKPQLPRPSFRRLALVIILFVFFNATFWSIRIRGFSRGYNFPTVSLSAFFRTTTSYVLFRAFAYNGKRDPIAIPLLPSTYRPANNIVFVVDESMRADHLSLNHYSRPTTPFLEQLAHEGLLRNWGTAVSSSTCSLDAHDFLITGVSVDATGAGEAIRKAPLIFQYAKAMRYKTYYLDGQLDTLWGEMAGDGITYVDEWLGASSFGSLPWDVDFAMAKKAREIISGSAGNFIFVFKRGVHAPQRSSFPRAATVWKPSYEGTSATGSPAEQPAVANAYDNGIKYNVDHFFQILGDDFHNLPNGTVIIYTGDHGQTLGEGGAKHTHCGETKAEASVPLFIVGSLDRAVDVNFKPAHANLFATALDLLGYPEELRKHSYALSLFKAKATDSRERFYISPTNPMDDGTPGRLLKFD
jgi:glucan phosphoethanolaminetransferase (alkaline phosphatase superfamily)